MNEENTNSYYTQYVETRPNPRLERFVKSWHGNVLRISGIEQLVDSEHRLKILEVGYGHGYFADIVEKKGHEYKATDISESVVALGVNKGHDVVLPQHLSESEQFDVVWLSHVLEHSSNWIDARHLLENYSRYLRPGGTVVCVGPDFLSWKNEFWSVDFSHGFPTTKRNCFQLFSDIGLKDVEIRYHRAGSCSLFIRACAWGISKLPHNPIDRFINRERHAIGEGVFYSWKSMYGWRQLLVVGKT